MCYVCRYVCSGKAQERFREVFERVQRLLYTYQLPDQIYSIFSFSEWTMNNSKLLFMTLHLFTIIIGCSLIITLLGYQEWLNLSLLPAKNHIITFFKKKEKERTIDIDSLTRIPRRQSNYTILNSKVSPMEFKLGDISDWISCPPAVILDFNKLN